MNIKCRARLSESCYDGRDCRPIYGEDSMEDDGTYDPSSDTVVCDPCYIAGGQPALDVHQAVSRQDVVDHVNQAMELGSGGYLVSEAVGRTETLYKITKDDRTAYVFRLWHPRQKGDCGDIDLPTGAAIGDPDMAIAIGQAINRAARRLARLQMEIES